MASIGNLVHQTSATTGTSDLTLSAVNGKVSFNTAFGTGGSNLFWYFVSNQGAAEWEVGTGHLSSSTVLVRDTVIASSNSNNAVNFSAGTKDVTNDIGAAQQAQLDVPNVWTAVNQFTTVELGHASQNTLSGSGGILSVEGVAQCRVAGAQTLTGGFKVSPYAAGTKSSGTYTPLYSDGNFQTATNGGAHTLAPPADDCSMVIQYTNNGSAGTITTSGYTRVTGDPLTTTNGDDFLFYVVKHGSFSHLNVVALQ